MGYITKCNKLLGRKRKLRKSKHKGTMRKYLEREIRNKHISHNIVNLTNTELSQSQKMLLEKGLSFVPTPNTVSLRTAYNSFCDFKRRMLIQYHFRDHHNDTIPIFRLRSKWEPPETHNIIIQNYLTNVWHDILNLFTLPMNISKNSANITLPEKQALEELQSINDITIKRADKGGRIVLMPNEMYTTEAYRQLNDPLYYTEQPIDHTGTLAYEITTFLTHLHTKKIIDNDLFGFLLPKNPIRTPIFYMLPKIHKPNNPGRPIISGCGSPTVNISKFLDHSLRPIVELSPSYIRDTTHFLQIVLNHNFHIPKDSWLVTLDVKSLYTSIPQNEGIECCLYAINEHYQGTPPLDIKHLQQMFEFVLKHNYFTFNDKFYLQTHGTAMGTKMAPNYANIFMTKIENHILQNAPHNRKPLLWKRFIDDIFLIWPYDLQSLLHFKQYINTIHNTIKFEMTHSQTSVNFLDTTIHFNSDGKLISSLYKKPTDICSLLHNNSFHPPTCKQSVIYSQDLRYRRVITDNEELQTKLMDLKLDLIQRGYHSYEINKQFNKIADLSQNDLLFKGQHNNTYSATPQLNVANHIGAQNTNNNTEDTTDDILHYHTPDPTISNTNISQSQIKHKTLPFIIPYDTRTIRIKSILKEHWRTLSRNEALSKIWTRPPVLALKTHKNIGNHITHTKF